MANCDNCVLASFFYMEVWCGRMIVNSIIN